MTDLSSCAYRVRLVRQLVDAWEEDAHHGIFGAGVCQVCGDFATFSGLYGAMASHRGPDLVGGREHRHSELERRAIAKRRWRYCELCRGRVPVTGAAGGPPYGQLCSECLAIVGQEAPARTLRDVLHRLARWRYWRMRNRPGRTVPPV